MTADGRTRGMGIGPALIAALLLAAAPLPATEAEIQAPPSEGEKSGEQAAATDAGEATASDAATAKGEPSQSEPPIDVLDLPTSDVNTLEDIFGYARADLGALLRLVGERPESAETGAPRVLWTEAQIGAGARTGTRADGSGPEAAKDED